MWLRGIFRSQAVEAELDDELRAHLEHEADKLVRQGVDPAEARRRARIAFGGLERIKDEVRDARGIAWIDAFRQDLRHAIRGIRRRPGFATAVVLTLGLGLGANVAMFGVVDRLFFRTPAFLRDPDRVHRVYITDHTVMSYRHYRDIVHWSSAFDAVAAYVTWGQFDVGEGEETRTLPLGVVSASYFDFFNARPALGRFFTEREDSVGAEVPVVVLSWSFWQTHYGGRNVLGQLLTIHATRCTIIGVAPPGFAGIDGAQAAAVFVPITMVAAQRPLPHPSDYYTIYGWYWINTLVRRRQGVSAAAASADLAHVFHRSAEAARAVDPHQYTAMDLFPSATLAPVPVGWGPEASSVSRVALWTGGVAVVVLLVACCNVANLFLVRGLERRREGALRLALGVSRGRLARHIMTEMAVLTGLASGVGLGVAWAVGRLLRALFLRGSADAGVLGDPRTLAFTALVALLAAAVAGLVPALDAGRGNLADLIKDGALGATRKTSWMRAALLLLQGAASVVLLVGGGLFVRSLQHAQAIRLGYDVDPVIFVTPVMRGRPLETADQMPLANRLADEARTIPGVTSVGLGNPVPFFNANHTDLFRVNHDSVPTAWPFWMHEASPDYFRTLGTRVIRGRAFTDADRAGAPPVMMISASMAKALWPGGEAIGQCLRPDADTMPCATIVGVTEDVKQTSLTDLHEGQYYFPLAQRGAFAFLFVRVNGRGSQFAETVRRRLQPLMPRAGFVKAAPMREIIDPAIRSWELGATMFVSLGALALVLAAIGLYSVIAYGVAQRTRELGVRVALGARVRDILWLVARGGLGSTIVGLVLGAALALAAGRWVEPLLFAERPSDPVVFGGVAILLIVAALAATVFPGLRATRVAPSIALRAD